MIGCVRPTQAEKVDVQRLQGIEKLEKLPDIYPGKIVTLSMPAAMTSIKDTYLIVDL